METLRQFLDRREGEVRDGLKALKAEMAELKRVRLSLDGTDVAAREAPNGQPAGFPTIKDMIRAVIKGWEDEGLASADVTKAIKVNYGPTLERTSLSPQLSRLRRDGELVLQDGRWFPTSELTYVELPNDLPKGSGAVQTPEPSVDGPGDGSRGEGSHHVPEGSIPSRSTFAAKKPAFSGGDFADDLDDDVPF